MAVAGSAVVLGATGGIGAALVAALEAEGRWRRVIGLSRRGASAVDITDEASLAAAASWLAAEAPDLALVVVATGFLHDGRFQPEKAMRQLDPEHLARSFALNAIGPGLLHMKVGVPYGWVESVPPPVPRVNRRSVEPAT
ncbi:MAG: NAD-dependent epimerase/dehydratase family protein, partial [Paracraurococcus sp.]